MKAIIQLILAGTMAVSVNLKSNGQINMPVDNDTKKITYKDVVTQEGTPKILYQRAVSWISSFYSNPSEVVKVRDTINSAIELKHRIKVWNYDKKGNKTTEADLVEYNMKIEFKEGRYRYTITDFNVKRVSKYPLERWMDKSDPDYSASCDSYLKQIDDEIQNVLKNLKEGMKPKVIKNDNW
jgi:hypothetical protein